MARYLLAGVAKHFRQKRIKKAGLAKKRQAQFRKGFRHKSSEPKSFNADIQLPKRGKSRIKTLKKRVKRGLYF